MQEVRRRSSFEDDGDWQGALGVKHMAVFTLWKFIELLGFAYFSAFIYTLIFQIKVRILKMYLSGFSAFGPLFYSFYLYGRWVHSKVSLTVHLPSGVY